METTLKKMTLEFLGTGQHKISVEKFMETENCIFLDLRSKEETESLSFNFDLFNIESVHIPIHQLPDRINELAKSKLIICFCSSGTRSAWAYIYLLSKGFNTKWLDAGNENLSALLKPGRVYKQTKQ